jgi:sugar lactone lactonase YvrE
MLKEILWTCGVSLVFSGQLFGHALKNNTDLYRSSDWITDNAFTNGVEGPAVDKHGVLYAVNYQKQGTIGKITGKDKVQTLLNLPNGSVGNGIRFDEVGNMYIADYINHNILKISYQGLYETSQQPIKAKVYAHSRLMNQPNDIAIMVNGILFASDPNWSKNTGQLWRINRGGEVVLLEKNMGTTNGIAISPDNKILYVNESVQGNVWQYQLSEEGRISNKSRLIHFSEHGLDGMRTDSQGNLYIARYGKGVVVIISPQGKLLREVKLKGQFPTNVAFGGADGKTVFVTMQKRGAIEKFTSEYQGRSFVEGKTDSAN